MQLAPSLFLLHGLGADCLFGTHLSNEAAYRHVTACCEFEGFTHIEHGGLFLCTVCRPATRGWANRLADHLRILLRDTPIAFALDGNTDSPENGPVVLLATDGLGTLIV